jgi:hypothetical protein
MAVLIEAIEVRVAAATRRQIALRLATEGVNQGTRGVTTTALHPKIFGLHRSAVLEKTERSLTVGLALMDEPAPREIVEMSTPTGHKEARWNGIGLALLFTDLMDEARFFRAIQVLLYLEQAGVELRERAAAHAA